ncbi:MAG: histidine phosphatase family protein [Alphaproteobacteria bacterium]|nr:histidine phosphatase family protein [Alphaproteobacteria bacterium]
MIPLALIRHGPTEWSDLKRYQGRIDTPLSEAGRAAVRTWRVPAAYQSYDWFSSPLARARETATILGARDMTIAPELIEMDWGDYQGHTYEALQARYGAAMTDNEARGLDFQPPGGESPRQVIARLRPWLAARARSGRPSLAVVHRGIVRALLAHATGWPMIGPPPARLDWTALHLFNLDGDGGFQVERLNIALGQNATAS